MDIDTQELDELTVGEIEKYLQVLLARFINKQELDIDSKEEYEKLVEELHSRTADMVNALRQEREGRNSTAIEKVIERLEDEGIR